MHDAADGTEALIIIQHHASTVASYRTAIYSYSQEIVYSITNDMRVNSAYEYANYQRNLWRRLMHKK